MRATWYFTMTLLEDEENQKLGFVNVISTLGPNGFVKDVGVLQGLAAIKHVLPDRAGCIHFCTDSPILFPILSMVAFVVPKPVRARMRHHYCGTVKELNYILSTYGVPPLPLNEDGTCSLTAHLEWITSRTKHEEAMRETKEKGGDETDTTTTTSGSSSIIVPHKFDVLFGRGRSISTHSGNVRG